MRIIGHFPTMRGIEQKSDRRVRHAAIGMLLGKPHELICDPAQWIQLKRMFTGPRFEELIESLFEINRRSARHVIQVVTFSIPGKRRPHSGAVTRMKKIVRSGKVLLPGKGRGSVSKVRSVIIKELATVLTRCAAIERQTHRRHRLDSRSLDSEEAHAPLTQGMLE